jgi:o-succinylbenzoate synthase
LVNLEVIPYTLKFNRPAKTSRNVFHERRIYLIKLTDQKKGVIAWGEAAPLSLLSVDDVDNYEAVLREFCFDIQEGQSLHNLDLNQYPSIRFGLETVLSDWSLGGEMNIFQSSFFGGEPIEINGLVWMSDSETMLKEANKKVDAGFKTIKFKVGALDFDEECRMLESFRSRFSSEKITVRLDANGAFEPGEAVEKLADLNRFGIHSIEQPILAGQWDAMQEICAKSTIDICLDEELIGIEALQEGEILIRTTRPSYLILKPNLLGGFELSDQWVTLANKFNIGWWATSALEGNVGLNAISQWVSKHKNALPQGLGTGSLYSNNIEGPLHVKDGFLTYRREADWEMP